MRTAITTLLLLFVYNKGISQRAPAIVTDFEQVMNYSKMRPMAMVKFFREIGKWNVDSDYVKQNMRVISLSYYGYRITTTFNDQEDFLSFETPPDRAYFDAAIGVLRRHQMEQKDRDVRNGNFYEIWDNSKTDILNMWMILIASKYSGDYVVEYKYDIVSHPD